ncbi:MAG: rod shape-determining protein MreC [Lachnospiraceae bacterium]|nr:rod shape-determining protein MreC [Lachnospiraceae bacterium]
MKRKMNDKSRNKAILTVLTIFCVLLIALSFLNENITSPFRQIAGTLITPVQKGVNHLGGWLSGLTENFSDAASLREENQALQEKVDTLTAENSQLVLDKEELTRLRELVQLSEEYSDYETVGARVIAKDSGNWFDLFTIDKGSDDGIQKDCNVIAGGGLVGIVTETGPNWATVRAIIDDNSNVSAMVSTTSDTCIIAGSLKLIDDGTLNLVKLTDENNKVHVGDKIVTSNISEKFLPGILVGYISELNNDANNLTKSGQITPVVDFKHLQEVLVIKELKNYVASPKDSEDNAVVNDVNGTEADSGQETETEDPDLLTAPRTEE